MKLTKGKISKLYKKNKQSVRKRKNGKGKTGRNRTFRKTKGLNLPVKGSVIASRSLPPPP